MKRKIHYTLRRKLLNFFLILIIILSTSGCINSRTQNNNSNSSPNTELTKYSDTDNEEFSNFTNEVFCDAITTDALSLHCFLEHPANYNITDYDVTLGRYELDKLGDTSEITECITKLETFSKESLSKKQQLTYDVLKKYLETELEYCDLYLLDSALSPTIGIQVQLPLIFAEYNFLEKKDVDEYLLLIKDSDEYFQNLIEYETLRAEKGFFMEDSLADEIITQCETFINTASSGYLIDTFDEKIDKLNIFTPEEISNYKSANKDAVNNHMIKAYTILRDGLTSLKGSNRYTGGLSNYPDGRTYFEYIIKQHLGNNRSVDEYDKLLDTYINVYMLNMQRIISKDSSVFNEFESFTFSMTDPNEILNDLKEKIKADFPKINDVDYTIDYIDKSLEDYASPAMYFKPQLDNLSQNSIYINGSSTNGNELYPTLAHEGYPGHLYQTQYFANTNPDMLRYILEPGGYIEGWATYVEVESYKYANTGNAALNELMCINYATTLCLYGKVDIGVNYKSWTIDDVYKYISSYGFTDKSIAEEMYKAMTSESGNYCQYVLGFLEITELKNKANLKLEDSFSLKNFHKYLLDYGPVPFEILNDGLEDWIEQQKST